MSSSSVCLYSNIQGDLLRKHYTILKMKYGTFRNFINCVTRPDYGDYVGRVWNESKDKFMSNTVIL